MVGALSATLAAWAVEGGSLGLHNAANAFGFAGRTDCSVLFVNAVLVLVASLLVECITISAVFQCRTFIPDRFIQNLFAGIGKSRDPGDREGCCRSCWRDSRSMQNLAGVDIADSDHELLVQ